MNEVIMAARPLKWLHRYAIFVAASTAVLLYWGGLVTSTGSGLAVPDWPLSYGMLMPPMVGGIFYEHGHRMVATFVGILTILLAVWIQRKDERRWMRILGWTALGTVIFQGLLGGLTVLFFLPLPISVFHATLAQTFFCITVAVALFTSPFWNRAQEYSLEPGRPSLRTISLMLVLAVYAQLIIGAIMRHMGAGLAIPDFPLAFGEFIPPIESIEVLVHFLHRLGALVVAAMVVWTTIHVRKRYRGENSLLIPTILLATLLVSQIALGAFVIWSGKSVAVTTFHLVTGAALLGTSVSFMLIAHRFVKPEAATEFATVSPVHRTQTYTTG
jgi:heme a synthase